MQQKQDVFWDFSIENAIWECENNCDFLSKVSKLVFWVYLRMHISYTHTSETSITNARTHVCVCITPINVFASIYLFYFETLAWKSCWYNFKPLTAARAPGFQIRNPAVAARGHTGRQGRSRAASWGRRFPRHARALFDAPLHSAITFTWKAARSADEREFQIWRITFSQRKS